MTDSRILVLIPARMAATRLPGKPLLDIAGLPMIVHVLRRAEEAELGRVVVATDDQAIAEAVARAGGEAVMTRADHPNGSARIHEAVERLDPEGRYGIVVNLQGDLPTVEAETVAACFAPLSDPEVDIATVATRIERAEDRADPNVVKVVGTHRSPTRLRALYFTRATAPWGNGPLFHHIGLYSYRREALRRYVTLPPSELETRERLEQLRALEAGMRIDVELVAAQPLGVDTPAELERARAILAGRPS
jgi:3-deoxy-manno-octulosonate cytidylyltransferase (CMP-KDO synthetase)